MHYYGNRNYALILFSRFVLVPSCSILIVRVSPLGDVVHNLPVLADIHRHFPDAVIDWVVEDPTSDL